MTTDRSATPAFTERLKDPTFLAYTMLRTVFTIAPILFGLDKFFNLLTHPDHWDKYLAGWIDNILPGNSDQGMYLIGVIEIVAGLLVAFAPRLGAWVVAAWLAGIIVDLLTLSGYYDVALRDFGLLVAAAALGVLARGVHTAAPEHAVGGHDVSV